MQFLTEVAELEALYGEVGNAATVKVADRITPEYRAWIEASPFCALATAGPEGLDCTPRGDQGAIVTIMDDRTLALPDRRGNNRTDSLRNVLRDPRVALMFLIPGSGTVIRVNGTARLTADVGFLAQFAVQGNAPRSVMVVGVEEVYFQCARAILRAGLWDHKGVDPATLPSPGDILSAQSEGAEGGQAYDAAWPARAKEKMW